VSNTTKFTELILVQVMKPNLVVTHPFETPSTCSRNTNPSLVGPMEQPESGSYSSGFAFSGSFGGAEPRLNGVRARQCSVRGCHKPLELGMPNKMCESCRGKHRIYASTKRKRRKIEKAAIEGQTVVPVEQIPGSAAFMPGAVSAPSQQDQPKRGVCNSVSAVGTWFI
jgi:hypothetical protein